ncbi:unnamed protein product [Phytomonas sp. EM1]|nr:unnamed protein product [Phytomonas sp. EM1]|eukprot:CCW61714.1 unnamed protein product [Phytomonas sp. isolate EM1]
MSKHVLVPVADGSEDIELSCLTDVLVRGGIKVTVASVMESVNVTLARGLKLVADALLKDLSASDFDAVLLPGGFDGSVNFGKSETLGKILHEMRRSDKLYGGICAAPVLSLVPLGALEGVKTATCYPGMESKFPAHINPSSDCVVKCGNCLTSRGPGTAMFFGLAAVALLRSSDVANQIAKDLLLDKYAEINTVLNLK